MFRVETPHDGVALLRMDDGKVNAIGPAFLDAFPRAWREATADDRAVVLGGNARAFCAGLDLKTLPTLPREELVRFARGFLRLFADVQRHPRPVVGAVDGPALAGGAVLALASDMRLVGPRARLGLTEVPVGIPFPGAVLDLARDALPANEHAPALLHGVIREGAACVAHGWAHEHAESAALEARAVALAADMGAHSRVAFAGAKRLLRGRHAEALDACAAKETDAWVDLLLQPETMEGLLAGFARMTRR